MEELNGMNHERLKEICLFFGIKGLNAKVSTLVNKINEFMQENGITELPSSEQLELAKSLRDEKRKEYEMSQGNQVQEEVVETTTVVRKPVAKAPLKIKDYPKKKVIVQSRDDEEQYQTFSVNDYGVVVTMGEEILLPEPIIDLIKGLTTIVHKPDVESGFNKAKEVNRYFVTIV